MLLAKNEGCASAEDGKKCSLPRRRGNANQHGNNPAGRNEGKAERQTGVVEDLVVGIWDISPG